VNRSAEAHLLAVRLLRVVGVAATALVVACGAPQRTVVGEASQVVDVIAPPAFSGWLRAAAGLRTGDTELAVAAMREVVDLLPSDAAARLRYARALGAHGHFDEARLQCRLAGELNADPSARVLECAAVEARDGRIDDALAMYRDATAEFSLSEPVYIAWVDLAARSEQHEARVVAAERYTAAFAESPGAWRSLAQARLATTGDAAAAFRRAAEVPGGAGSDAELAAALSIESGDEPAAREAIALCKRRYREYSRCYLMEAYAEHTFGAAEATQHAAIDTLAQRTAGDPRQIASSAARMSELAMGPLVARYLESVAAARPANRASLSAAAWAAYRSAMPDLSVSLMERVLAVDPTNFDALNFIGYEWAERGIRLDEAEIYVREALMLRPDDTNMLDSLAWIFFRRGQFGEALAIQRQVIAREPENAVLLDHMGDICVALGDRQCARKVFTRALEIAGPGDEDVLETVPAKLEALGE
jgi:tetratricopeptide (TPR) repeat protein